MENKTLMKALIYIRVSTDEQVKGYSLTYQEELCRDYCKKQGWDVAKVFREEGESAKTANRTQLIKLLDYCKENKGKVDVVLVHKLDRLARASADHHAIRASLNRYGFVIRSVSEPIDETSQGRFMENIYAAVAQLDNDVRAERTKEGLKERVRQGMWAWGAPLGYLNSPTGLIIDTDRYQLILKAFETYSTGNYTIRDIANKLNKWGLRTRGNKKISPQTVTKTFDNKLYISRLVVPKWNMDVEGIHQRIVEPELFYKVQAIRQGKSFTAVPRLVKNPDFPLKNIVKCSECDLFLTGSWSKGRNQKYAYYHCTKCNSTRVPKTQLEEQFLSALKRIQPNKEYRKLFTEVLMDVWKQKHSESTTRLDRVEKEVIQIKELKNKLIEKNLNGVISDEDYKDQIDIINNQLTVKEIERSEERETGTNLDHLVALVESLLSNVAMTWFDAPFMHKLRFQSLMFPTGVFYKDGIIGTADLGLPFSLIGNGEVQKTTIVTQPHFLSNRL